MGKRKERRLAAKTAVNRRVKLDLLAEPSGDFGDSTNKEEVGGGGNAKNHTGSPNSPSSSGQNPENPLLLLGQYSDEETEEESGKEISHDTRENSPAELDEQVKVDIHEGTEPDKDENFTADKIDQENKENSSSLPNMEENGVIEDSNTIVWSHKDTDVVEQTSVPLTSDPQTGDTDSGWKMVLHEESNSYYYWNIVTGETSWEVPAVLGQGNESAYDPKAVMEVQECHVTSVDPHIPNATLNAEVVASVEHTDIVEGNDVNKIDGLNYGSSHEGFVGHSNDALSNGKAHHADFIQENHGTVSDLASDSSGLLQLGEKLSERLNSLKGFEGFNDQRSKLMMELDIRLADIKSLVPYGSSLLPFWLHSENHLRKLEAAINDEILKCSQSANIGETENKLQENISEANANEKNAEMVEDHENEIVGVNSLEDEDMDVEMEVEDEPDQIPPNPEHGSEHESGIPPPLNDEWVPPPPPDDEPLPPPPPDELPEASFPPPPLEMQTSQAYGYGEQYNYTYAGSGFEYYGQSQTTTQVPNHEYYIDANGCQVAAAPISTLYYPAAPNPYPDVTSVMNPVEPVTYYTLQETTPLVATSATSTLSAPPAATVTEPVTKAQAKVVRNKKRTVATVPGLRSNKKVSGLVDKWKAVKEELHEDEEEDEPENAYEVLEKKKQREIEQWHAQQIATGEAKDNANFQPLGGDWRERVKRKRAKKSMESEESDEKNTKKKPDLGQLSKELSSGWQAYWDESSKQVYYANSKTSETTWTKPKN